LCGCEGPMRRSIQLRWQKIVRAAYRPVFGSVDPAQDDLAAIDDAFQRYAPVEQRQHMVRLFVALGHEAGLVPEEILSETRSGKPRQQQSPQRSSTFYSPQVLRRTRTQFS
jgi:hypothetical protein